MMTSPKTLPGASINPLLIANPEISKGVMLKGSTGSIADEYTNEVLDIKNTFSSTLVDQMTSNDEISHVHTGAAQVSGRSRLLNDDTSEKQTMDSSSTTVSAPLNASQGCISNTLSSAQQYFVSEKRCKGDQNPMIGARNVVNPTIKSMIIAPSADNGQDSVAQNTAYSYQQMSPHTLQTASTQAILLQRNLLGTSKRETSSRELGTQVVAGNHKVKTVSSNYMSEFERYVKTSNVQNSLASNVRSGAGNIRLQHNVSFKGQGVSGPHQTTSEAVVRPSPKNPQKIIRITPLSKGTPGRPVEPLSGGFQEALGLMRISNVLESTHDSQALLPSAMPSKTPESISKTQPIVNHNYNDRQFTQASPPHNSSASMPISVNGICDLNISPKCNVRGRGRNRNRGRGRGRGLRGRSGDIVGTTCEQRLSQDRDKLDSIATANDLAGRGIVLDYRHRQLISNAIISPPVHGKPPKLTPNSSETFTLHHPNSSIQSSHTKTTIQPVPQCSQDFVMKAVTLVPEQTNTTFVTSPLPTSINSHLNTLQSCRPSKAELATGTSRVFGAKIRTVPMNIVCPQQVKPHIQGNLNSVEGLQNRGNVPSTNNIRTLLSKDRMDFTPTQVVKLGQKPQDLSSIAIGPRQNPTTESPMVNPIPTSAPTVIDLTENPSEIRDINPSKKVVHSDSASNSSVGAGSNLPASMIQISMANASTGSPSRDIQACTTLSEPISLPRNMFSKDPQPKQQSPAVQAPTVLSLLQRAPVFSQKAVVCTKPERMPTLAHGTVRKETLRLTHLMTPPPAHTAVSPTDIFIEPALPDTVLCFAQDRSTVSISAELVHGKDTCIEVVPKPSTNTLVNSKEHCLHGQECKCSTTKESSMTLTGENDMEETEPTNLVITSKQVTTSYSAKDSTERIPLTPVRNQRHLTSCGHLSSARNAQEMGFQNPLQTGLNPLITLPHKCCKEVTGAPPQAHSKIQLEALQTFPLDLTAQPVQEIEMGLDLSQGLGSIRYISEANEQAKNRNVSLPFKNIVFSFQAVDYSQKPTDGTSTSDLTSMAEKGNACKQNQVSSTSVSMLSPGVSPGLNSSLILVNDVAGSTKELLNTTMLNKCNTQLKGNIENIGNKLGVACNVDQFTPTSASPRKINKISKGKKWAGSNQKTYSSKGRSSQLGSTQALQGISAKGTITKQRKHRGMSVWKVRVASKEFQQMSEAKGNESVSKKVESKTHGHESGNKANSYTSMSLHSKRPKRTSTIVNVKKACACPGCHNYEIPKRRRSKESSSGRSTPSTPSIPVTHVTDRDSLHLSNNSHCTNNSCEAISKNTLDETCLRTDDAQNDRIKSDPKPRDIKRSSHKDKADQVEDGTDECESELQEGQAISLDQNNIENSNIQNRLEKTSAKKAAFIVESSSETESPVYCLNENGLITEACAKPYEPYIKKEDNSTRNKMDREAATHIHEVSTNAASNEHNNTLSKRANVEHWKKAREQNPGTIEKNNISKYEQSNLRQGRSRTEINNLLPNSDLPSFLSYVSGSTLNSQNSNSNIVLDDPPEDATPGMSTMCKQAKKRASRKGKAKRLTRRKKSSSSCNLQSDKQHKEQTVLNELAKCNSKCIDKDETQIILGAKRKFHDIVPQLHLPSTTIKQEQEQGCYAAGDKEMKRSISHFINDTEYSPEKMSKRVNDFKNRNLNSSEPITVSNIQNPLHENGSLTGPSHNEQTPTHAVIIRSEPGTKFKSDNALIKDCSIVIEKLVSNVSEKVDFKEENGQSSKFRLKQRSIKQQAKKQTKQYKLEAQSWKVPDGVESSSDATLKSELTDEEASTSAYSDGDDSNEDFCLMIPVSPGGISNASESQNTIKSEPPDGDETTLVPTFEYFSFLDDTDKPDSLNIKHPLHKSMEMSLQEKTYDSQSPEQSTKPVYTDNTTNKSIFHSATNNTIGSSSTVNNQNKSNNTNEIPNSLMLLAKCAIEHSNLDVEKPQSLIKAKATRFILKMPTESELTKNDNAIWSDIDKNLEQSKPENPDAIATLPVVYDEVVQEQDDDTIENPKKKKDAGKSSENIEGIIHEKEMITERQQETDKEQAHEEVLKDIIHEQKVGEQCPQAFEIRKDTVHRMESGDEQGYEQISHEDSADTHEASNEKRSTISTDVKALSLKQTDAAACNHADDEVRKEYDELKRSIISPCENVRIRTATEYHEIFTHGHSNNFSKVKNGPLKKLTFPRPIGLFEKIGTSALPNMCMQTSDSTRAKNKDRNIVPDARHNGIATENHSNGIGSAIKKSALISHIPKNMKRAANRLFGEGFAKSLARTYESTPPKQTKLSDSSHTISDRNLNTMHTLNIDKICYVSLQKIDAEIFKSVGKGTVDSQNVAEVKGNLYLEGTTKHNAESSDHKKSNMNTNGQEGIFEMFQRELLENRTISQVQESNHNDSLTQQQQNGSEKGESDKQSPLWDILADVGSRKISKETN